MAATHLGSYNLKGIADELSLYRVTLVDNDAPTAVGLAGSGRTSLVLQPSRAVVQAAPGSGADSGSPFAMHAMSQLFASRG